MKLDFEFNFHVAVVVLCSLIVFSFSLDKIIEYRSAEIEFNKYLNQQTPYVFDFSCDSGYDSKYYYCPTNESFRNISGTFCYGRQICESKYRLK